MYIYCYSGLGSGVGVRSVVGGVVTTLLIFLEIFDIKVVVGVELWKVTSAKSKKLA